MHDLECDGDAGTPAVTDNQPIEVGLKFRSDVDGFVTAIRFYKGSLNTGTHVGHLWSSTGVMLAEATFNGETASGWQEVSLSPAVAISANTTYIASYHSSGYFAFDNGFFATASVDNAPLHALQAGVDGANGVFKYGASAFPDGGGSNNYWIDVVFQTSLAPDTTPPTITQQLPASGATGVALASSVRALFSEAVDATTVTASTFELRDPANQPISAASVSYEPAARTAVLTTTAGLLSNATYTATVKGGTSGVHDLAGNALAADAVWSFTTGTPVPPTDDGPGGPILVIASTSNPFGRYYGEILRAEGLNAFTVTDISLVNPTLLGGYDVVILGEMPLTSSQVSMLSGYVSGGGNLIAMRPDKQLASLLGLVDASSTLANGYLLVNTASSPGAGIVGETMQFHSLADRYMLAGEATWVVATLYAKASTATTNPAVTMTSVGANGGHAAAFAFDLARSVVYTRQGNPGWSGQERDGPQPLPTSPPLIRSDDLFYGAAAGDPQPDWVDLTKVAIPQADEQQRLLVNLVQYLNRSRKPLPRFWYLPRGLKAALVMTGDDHGNGGTVGRFDQYKSLSSPGCSVADWGCVRSTSYIYNGTPGMTDAASLAYEQDGFEVALHISSDCANWTPSSLESRARCSEHRISSASTGRRAASSTRLTGTVVASHGIAIAGPLRPLVSDFNVGEGAVSVDWMRMGPYAAAGTFLSRVIDAGAAASWHSATWTARTPSDTAIVMAVRTGNTPTPDASWSAFTTVCASGGAIGTSGRYAQYRVVLVGSTDTQSTPALEQVDISYSTP